jgi:hypothetical protein
MNELESKKAALLDQLIGCHFSECFGQGLSWIYNETVTLRDKDPELEAEIMTIYPEKRSP